MAYSADPALYIYTSLTSGSSHIVTATARLETILRANKVPFKAIDIATDEKARMLWGRRAGKDEGGRPRKIPGLVQEGLVLGVRCSLPAITQFTDLLQDLVEIEDWNEYGELKQHIRIVPVDGPGAVKVTATPPSKPAAKKFDAPAKATSSPTVKQEKDADEPKAPAGGTATAFTLAMRQAGQEAAQKAKDAMKTVATFTGVGKAEPAKEEKSVKLAPGHIDIEPRPQMVEAITRMQDPTSSAWSQVVGKAASVNTTLGHKESECMQSPTSTAWRPVESAPLKQYDEPMLIHRGSEISLVSAECIKKVEDEEMIPEEEEEEEEE